jgi:hypothetical protein
MILEKLSPHREQFSIEENNSARTPSFEEIGADEVDLEDSLTVD